MGRLPAFYGHYVPHRVGIGPKGWETMASK